MGNERSEFATKGSIKSSSSMLYLKGACHLSKIGNGFSIFVAIEGIKNNFTIIGLCVILKLKI
jgi:hypothetical protein